jgi:hypothetical protein
VQKKKWILKKKKEQIEETRCLARRARWRFACTKDVWFSIAEREDGGLLSPSCVAQGESKKCWEIDEERKKGIATRIGDKKWLRRRKLKEF